ncbi:MAG: hypothetical protein LBL90_13745 [Prevotellaceae bacterium]|nr:hypothetical protein [Prevotellaceae bacterium]
MAVNAKDVVQYESMFGTAVNAVFVVKYAMNSTIGMTVCVMDAEKSVTNTTLWIKTVGVIVAINIFMFGKKFMMQTVGMKTYQFTVENAKPVEKLKITNPAQVAVEIFLWLKL